MFFRFIRFVLLLLLLLLLRNPQNQTEYNYEKLNLTIMVNSWWTMWLLRLLDWCWISPVSSPLFWRNWSCLLQYPSSSSSFPMTDPYTLQDVLEFQEFYRHRTCNLSHLSMTFYDWYEQQLLCQTQLSWVKLRLCWGWVGVVTKINGPMCRLNVQAQCDEKK